MIARVSTLFKNGKRVSKVSKTVEGDLNLSVSRHQVTGSVCTEAVVLDTKGVALIDPMIDAHCVLIAAHGFRLRGVELVGLAREVSQEWWCVPLHSEQPKP